METTEIRTKGILNTSKVMLYGTILLNPDRVYIDAAQKLELDKVAYIMGIRSRVPDLDQNDTTAIFKVYDGALGYSNGNEYPIINTEIIGDSIVKTYNVSITESGGYTDPLTGKVYLGRLIYMIDEHQVPWRVDIIGDNHGNELDFTQSGSSESGYDYPMTIDAEQIKYSTISSKGGYLIITRNTGIIQTEWFKDNETLRRIDVRGPNIDIQGTILDFVSAAKTLYYFNFGKAMGIKGSMTEFLNAAKDSGVKSKYIDIHITNSGITNDVYVYDDDPSKVDPGIGATGIYYAVFDVNGDWRCQKSL